MTLKEVKKIDIRKEIKSHLEATSLDALLARYFMTGDTSLLNQRASFYEDFGDLDAYDDLQTMTEKNRAAVAHVNRVVEASKRRKEMIDRRKSSLEAKEVQGDQKGDQKGVVKDESTVNS